MTGRTRRKTKAWLAGHQRDFHVQRAGAEGYRSRSAYKLIELDGQLKLLAKAKVVIDLGAAPGGWCQVVVERAPAGVRLLGVDRLSIDDLAGAQFMAGDFTEAGCLARLADFSGGKADLVLCDAAPDISGIRDRDDAGFEDLHDAVANLCESCRAKAVLLKTFQGQPLAFALERLGEIYAKVETRNTKATRKRSRECYVFCKLPRKALES